MRCACCLPLTALFVAAEGRRSSYLLAVRCCRESTRGAAFYALAAPVLLLVAVGLHAGLVLPFLLLRAGRVRDVRHGDAARGAWAGRARGRVVVISGSRRRAASACSSRGRCGSVPPARPSSRRSPGRRRSREQSAAAVARLSWSCPVAHARRSSMRRRMPGGAAIIGSSGAVTQAVAETLGVAFVVARPSRGALLERAAASRERAAGGGRPVRRHHRRRRWRSRRSTPAPAREASTCRSRWCTSIVLPCAVLGALALATRERARDKAARSSADVRRRRCSWPPRSRR